MLQRALKVFTQACHVLIVHLLLNKFRAIQWNQQCKLQLRTEREKRTTLAGIQTVIRCLSEIK